MQSGKERRILWGLLDIRSSEALGSTLGKLVSEPLINFKDAIANFSTHAQKVYHNRAMLLSDEFVKSHSSANVLEQMST